MTRQRDEVDKKFTLLPEIRERLKLIEIEFTKPSAYGHGEAVVDLTLMEKYMSPESFRSYLEAKRELAAMDRQAAEREFWA